MQDVLEYEDAAKLTLQPSIYATIAGSNRAAFDRITFRPRMLIPTVDLDLSVELFGESHFTPILVGPVSEQRRYHADAELATVRGASQANTTIIVSDRSSIPVADLAARTTSPLWYAVYSDAGANGHKLVQQAIGAGCKMIRITARGADTRLPIARVDWKAIDQIRGKLDIPVVIKGVMTTDDAKTAVAQGFHGIVVSKHGSEGPPGPAPIDLLASVVVVVGGKAVVLIDGSFRRGTDILKALVLGAWRRTARRVFRA